MKKNSFTAPQSAAEIKSVLRKYLWTLEVGARLPPERQLAEDYRVSRCTVSNILGERESEGLLVRRIGNGTFVTPRDTVAIPAFALTDQAEALLVYPDFFSFGIWEQVHRLEVAARGRNFRLNHLRVQPESEWDLLFQLVERNKNIRGIVIVVGMPLRKSLLKRLGALELPVIFIGKVNDIAPYSNCYNVSNNHFLTGYQKLEVLVRNGHRRIGLIHNEPSTPAFQENIRGIKEAARDFKLPWRSLVQPDSRIDCWQDSLESGYFQTLEVMRKAPSLTALIVDTTQGAIGALRALHELKLRCPDDVSIITALANARIEEFTCPKLSTVITPTEEITAIVIRILTGENELPLRDFRVNSTVVERESVRNLIGKVKL